MERSYTALNSAVVQLDAKMKDHVRVGWLDHYYYPTVQNEHEFGTLKLVYIYRRDQLLDLKSIFFAY
jgi:hypothetical protein